MNTRFHGRSRYHLVHPALIAGLLAAAGSGCAFYDGEPEPCSSEARPGLLVSVVDFETGAPLPATIEVSDGAYREEAGPAGVSGDEYAAAYERAGVYDIAVSSEGYFPETITGVEVSAGGCHVLTEEIVVRLISDDAVGCTDESVPALVITVVDAVTKMPIPAAVKVSDGAYVEELDETQDDGEYRLAYERAGVYDIEVSSDGYIAATIEDVEVTEDLCHVISRTFEVALTRE
jgi:hypothetical protein